MVFRNGTLPTCNSSNDTATSHPKMSTNMRSETEAHTPNIAEEKVSKTLSFFIPFLSKNGLEKGFFLETFNLM